MPMDGSGSYVIIGEQPTDWDTPALTAAMKEIVYEFTRNSLRSTSTPIIPTRFKGNPSPIIQIDGVIAAEGDLEMHLHAEDMLIWWYHILMCTVTELDSTDFTAQEVFGNGSGVAKSFKPTPVVPDTQPNATSPTSDPALLIFTLNASDSGVFTITGTDQNDVVITETLTFGAVDTMTTTQYYKTITSITFTGFSVAVDLLIMADKNTWTHVLTLGDTVTKGITIESVKGTIPSTYVGCLLNQGVVSIAEIITFTVSILAKQGWNRYKVPAAGTTPTASETGTTVSGYSRVEDNVFPTWLMKVTLDGAGSPIPVETAGFAFNNQLQVPTRYTGERTMPKPLRGDNRDITLTLGVDYDTVNADYDVKFLVSTDIIAQFLAQSMPYAGPYYSIQMDLPRCRLAAYPDPEVSEYSQIMQELLLRPVRTIGATASDEMSMTIVTTEATP